MNKKDTHGVNAERTAHHSGELKDNILKRLGRIEGQIRGISRMVNENTYCNDVLQQISSVESALDGVKTVLLEAHLRSCIIEQIRDGKDDVMDELIVTLRKFMR